MKIMRILALAVVAVMTLSTLAVAAPSKAKPAKPVKVKSYKAGDLFCPSAALVVGSIVVQSGRCYVLFVLRDTRGTFMAFADPAVKIPPGQIVRMSTPAGAKIKGRIFYLIPIRTTAVIVPMNSLTMIAVRADDFGPQLSLTIISTPTPNLTVFFNVRL